MLLTPKPLKCLIAKIICLILVISSGFGLSCASLLKKSSARESALSLAPQIQTGTLANGLNYYFLANNKPQSRCYLRFVVGVGSFHEEENERGAAHMVEHLAFSDRSVSTTESLAEWFQKNGMAFGPDANAFTYPEITVYKVDLPTCESASIEKALAVFRSFADGLQLSDADITKEKNIIDREESEHNTAEHQLAQKLINHLYSGTSYISRPVLGTKESRAALTKDQLTAFYKKWYQADNMSIIIVGDFSDAQLPTLLENNFASLPQGATPKKPTSKNPDHRAPFFSVQDSEFSHIETVFTIQTKELLKPQYNRAVLRERIALELAITILKEKFAVLFNQSETMINQVSLNGFVLDEDAYELTLNIQSQENYEELFKAAYLELQRAVSNGFAGEDFLKAQVFYEEFLNQAITAEENMDSNSWAVQILNRIAGHDVATSAQQNFAVMVPLLRELSPRDSQRALERALKSGYHYLYAVGAIAEGEEINNRLKKLLNDARNQNIHTEPQATLPQFNYAQPNCESKVTLSSLPQINGSIAKLANGIDVIMKSTSFKNDEIIVEIITDEGFSSMNEKDFALARLAKPILLQGGLNQNSAADIVKITNNKYFNLNLVLYDNRIQATIVTRKADLRFALELARAYITDPHYDEIAINRLKEQVKVQYAELGHKLWKPLQHDFIKALTNNDYRVGLVPIETILNASRDDLLAWHKKYITDKALRVVVVGDIDPSSELKDIACTIGTLPAHEATPAVTIAKLPIKAGVNQVYNIDSNDEASLVTVRYPLSFPGKLFPDHRWQILRAIIEETMRLKLREKKQASYAPSVLLVESKTPFAQNWLDINLSVDQNESINIRDDIKKLLDKLITRGISTDALAKAKEPYLAKAQQSFQENAHWASVLANNFSEASSGNLQWINRIGQDLQNITIKEINNLLKTYFGSKNSSSVIMHPKNTAKAPQ